MISLIVVIILAISGKLAAMDIEPALMFPLLGILAEVSLIWLPFVNRAKWYKKTSYFKYLMKMFF